MDVDEIIAQRKSIRSFQNTPVPDDMLESLVNVAHQAPSWMNKQCWHFIIITDKGTIEEIAQASIINRWLKQAPALIMLCADPFLSGKRNDLSYYLVDAAIAFDHLILSATDKGLGTCWIGSFDEEKIKKFLEYHLEFVLSCLHPLATLRKKNPLVIKYDRLLFVVLKEKHYLRFYIGNIGKYFSSPYQRNCY